MVTQLIIILYSVPLHPSDECNQGGKHSKSTRISCHMLSYVQSLLHTLVDEFGGGMYSSDKITVWTVAVQYERINWVSLFRPESPNLFRVV